MIWRSQRKTMSERQKIAVAYGIADLLATQISALNGKSGIESKNGGPKPKALGYVYGYVSAALAAKDLKMWDPKIGVPITFHVVRRLWPGKEHEYMRFLAYHQRDSLVLSATLQGGQEYVDFSKQQAAGAAQGLALFMSAED